MFSFFKKKIKEILTPKEIVLTASEVHLAAIVSEIHKTSVAPVAPTVPVTDDIIVFINECRNKLHSEQVCLKRIVKFMHGASKIVDDENVKKYLEATADGLGKINLNVLDDIMPESIKDLLVASEVNTVAASEGYVVDAGSVPCGVITGATCSDVY